MAVKKFHVVGGSIIPQPDFDQTDETQADFIKNKPDGVNIGRKGTGDGAEIFNDYENNEANGAFTHVEGQGAVANSDCQHVQGKFNEIDSEGKYLDIVGNGMDNDNRSNAYTLDHDGNAWFAGDVYVHELDENGDYKTKLATEDYVNDVVSIQSDYAELDFNSPKFIQNKPFGEVQPYSGLLAIPAYTGEEVSTNEVEFPSGLTAHFVKIADLETDHQNTISSISEVELTNGKKYSGTGGAYGLMKKYDTDSSKCTFGGGCYIVAVEEGMTYILSESGSPEEYEFTFPEAGLYFLYFGWWPSKISFDNFIKKIDETFMPESYATKNYVDDVLDGIATSGGQVQADYAETDDTKVSFIKNKPTVDTQPIKNSPHLISSGAVFDAIDSLGTSGGSGEIVNGSITTEKLKDGAVTPTKLDRTYLTEHQSLDGYATETYVDEKIEEVKTSDGIVTENYIKKVEKLPINPKENEFVELTKDEVFDWDNVEYTEALEDVKGVYNIRFSTLPETIDLEPIKGKNIFSAIVFYNITTNQQIMLIAGEERIEIVFNQESNRLYYIDAGETVENFTAPSSGWYKGNTYSTVEKATTDDLKLLNGIYNVFVVDYGKLTEGGNSDIDSSIDYIMNLLVNKIVVPIINMGVYTARHGQWYGYNFATKRYVDEKVSELNTPDTDTEVPTKLSDLEDDFEHRLVTDAEKDAWNSKSNFSGSYNDLTDKPEIPTVEGFATKEELNQLLDSFAALLDAANREVL